MAITVKHSKVSTIPDDADTSLVRPSDWNDDHVLTGTVPVANGGTGAATLTGYVKGNGTSAMTASATVPSTDITGLGTMSTQNANAVAITGGNIDGTTIGGTTPDAITATSLNDSGNLTFTGTSNRITGDFSNATVANRVMFQSSTANGITRISAIPNGSGAGSIFTAYGATDPTNSGTLSFYQNASASAIIASITGTGTYTPLTFSTSGSERFRITTNGGFAWGGGTNYGTSGQVLQSNGDAVPTWVTPSSGTVTSVSGTAPIASSGGTTPTISISQSTTSTDGYLSSTDWNTFNGKQATLVSGTNIKTINSTSLLGSGDIAIAPMVYPAAGIPNSTGTAWGTSYSTTGSGTVVALATRPTMSVTGAGFTLQDATDNTKQANFVLSSIGTGLTVQYTLPQPPTSGTTSTLLDIQSTQAISGSKTFTGLTQNLGSSTGATTTNIAYGATTTGTTKTVNIGTGGVSGSTTTITIGSTTGTNTTTVNGVLKQQTYTVSTLPSASTSGTGSRSFVTDALAPTFGATVAGSGAIAVPVYSDGTNWKVG